MVVDAGKDLARQNVGLGGSSNHWLQEKTESRGGGIRVRKEFPPQHNVGFVIQYNQHVGFIFLSSYFFYLRKKKEMVTLQRRARSADPKANCDEAPTCHNRKSNRSET